MQTKRVLVLLAGLLIPFFASSFGHAQGIMRKAGEAVLSGGKGATKAVARSIVGSELGGVRRVASGMGAAGGEVRVVVPGTSKIVSTHANTSILVERQVIEAKFPTVTTPSLSTAGVDPRVVVTAPTPLLEEGSEALYLIQNRNWLRLNDLMEQGKLDFSDVTEETVLDLARVGDYLALEGLGAYGFDINAGISDKALAELVAQRDWRTLSYLYKHQARIHGQMEDQFRGIDLNRIPEEFRPYVEEGVVLQGEVRGHLSLLKERDFTQLNILKEQGKLDFSDVTEETVLRLAKEEDFVTLEGLRAYGFDINARISDEAIEELVAQRNWRTLSFLYKHQMRIHGQMKEQFRGIDLNRIPEEFRSYVEEGVLIFN